MVVMKRIRWIGLTGILVWGMVGCASQSDIRILEDRVVALERRNLELEQQTTETIDARAAALRNQSASLSAATDQVRNDIQELNGKIEEVGFQLSSQTKSTELLTQRVDRIEQMLQLPPMGEGQGAYVPGAPASPGMPQTATTAPLPAGVQPPAAAQSAATEGELYTAAKQAFDQGDFAAARDGFQKLLLQYPKARNADSAQFWIGETFYREKEYEQAILEYQTVIEKYPKGNKVQAALLKQGFAFAGMGDKANARLILQELIEKYPNSSEAKMARQKMGSL